MFENREQVSKKRTEQKIVAAKQEVAYIDLTQQGDTHIMSDYQRGLIITVCGVLFVTPDSLFVRLIDAQPITIAFWRSATSGVLIMTFLLLFEGRSCFRVIMYIGNGLALLFSHWLHISCLCPCDCKHQRCKCCIYLCHYSCICSRLQPIIPWRAIVHCLNAYDDRRCARPLCHCLWINRK